MLVDGSNDDDESEAERSAEARLQRRVSATDHRACIPLRDWTRRRQSAGYRGVHELFMFRRYGRNTDARSNWNVLPPGLATNSLRLICMTKAPGDCSATLALSAMSSHAA